MADKTGLHRIQKESSDFAPDKFYLELSKFNLSATKAFLIFQAICAIILLISSSAWMIIPYLIFSLLGIYIYGRLAIIYDFNPPDSFLSAQTDSLGSIKSIYRPLSKISYNAAKVVGAAGLIFVMLICRILKAWWRASNDSRAENSMFIIKIGLALIFIGVSFFAVSMTLEKFVPVSERLKKQ